MYIVGKKLKLFFLSTTMYVPTHNQEETNKSDTVFSIFKYCYSFNNRVLSSIFIIIKIIYFANFNFNNFNLACRIKYCCEIFKDFHRVLVSTSIYLFHYVCLLPLLFLQEQECHFFLIVKALIYFATWTTKFSLKSSKCKIKYIFKLMCV